MFGYNGIGLGFFVGLLSGGSGIHLVDKGDCIGLVVVTKVRNCLLGLGLLYLSLGDGEVGLEVRQGPVHSRLGIPFSDITNKYVAICDDDQADIDELDVGRGGSGCFLNGGVFIDMMEYGGNMLGMILENIFDVEFILCKLLGNDVSIGVKNSL